MSTHYTAGGMPLAFTQEDFLVFRYVHTATTTTTAIAKETLIQCHHGMNVRGMKFFKIFSVPLPVQHSLLSS